MNHRPNSLGNIGMLTMAILSGAIQITPANAAAVLAPVVEVKGSANWAGPGATRGAALKSGASLAEGGAISTGGDSQVAFSPVPGIAVTAAKSTAISVVKMDVTKSGETVQKRDVVLQLDSGALSFSVDKKNAGKTSFTVLTKPGTVDVQNAVGTIAVNGSKVTLASLSGPMSFSPAGGGAAISVEPGSMLSAAGSQITVVNAITRTTTTYSATGAPLGTRTASVQELKSASGLFAATLGHAALAVSFGLLSSTEAAGLTSTLTAVNQSLASVGLAAVEATSVGTSTPTAAAGDAADGPVTAPSFSGASANPANTTGAVISRER